MIIQTEQGHNLELSLDQYEGQPTVVFGHQPYSYYCTTILEKPDNEGLCLQGGGHTEYVSVSGDTIDQVKQWIREQTVSDCCELHTVTDENGKVYCTECQTEYNE